MPFITQGKTNWKFLAIVIILAVIVGGGAFWCSSKKVEQYQLPETKKLEIPKEFVASAIWDCGEIKGCVEKWHNCGSLDCVTNVMEQYNASSGAIDFTTKLGSDLGYLNQFQEMGKIDLGTVVFPFRANTNEAYYLINGSPILISTEISQDAEQKLITEMEKDPLYSEIKNKYPDIFFWGFAPQFVEKESLANNNERFIFEYRLVNGCRICDTEYAAQIGFDFSSNGKFLEITFLRIKKGKLEV